MARLPDSMWLEYVQVACYILVFMFNLSICSLGMSFQFKYGHQMMSSKLIKLAWCALLSYLLCVTFRMLLLLILLDGRYDEGDSEMVLLDVTSNILYGIGNSFIYLLFIERVRMTFDKTAYQLPRYTYVASYLLIAVNLASYVLTSLFQIAYALQNTTQSRAFLRSFLIQTMVDMFFDCVLCVTFLWIFLYKLLKATTQIMADTDSSGAELSKSQSKLVHLCVKTFLLSFIAIASTQVTIAQWLGYNVFYELSGYDHEAYQTNNVYYVLLCLFPFDTAINTLCILLQFKFMEKVYSLACTGCHALLYAFCAKRAKRRSNRVVSQHTSLFGNAKPNAYVYLHVVDGNEQ